MSFSDARSRRARREVVNHDRVHTQSFCVEGGTSQWHFWHCHSEIELLYVTHGSGVRYVGESIVRFAPGDLCLVGREVPHAWMWDQGDCLKGALFVQFPYGLVADAVRGGLGSRLMSLLDKSEQGLRIVRHEQEVLEEMKRISAASDRPDEMLARTLVVLSLLEGEGTCAPLTAEKGGANGQPAAIRKVLRHVHQHFTEDIPQRTMAKLLKLSPAAFSRFFKQHIGRAFRPYIIELRVAHACRLLRDSDQSVSEIAFASGFANLANFNRQFKRVRNETPRAYRERARRLW